MEAVKRYELKPLVWHEEPLVFDWDSTTGEVSGPGAQRILEIAAWGEVPAHPHPWLWTLSAAPTRSLVDMAVIVGWRHELPEDLAEHYPSPEAEAPAEGDAPAAELVY